MYQVLVAREMKWISQCDITVADTLRVFHKLQLPFILDRRNPLATAKEIQQTRMISAQKNPKKIPRVGDMS